MELTKDELKLVDEIASENNVTKEKAKEALLIIKQILNILLEAWRKVKQIVSDAVRSLSEATGLTERQVVNLISNKYVDTH